MQGIKNLSEMIQIVFLQTSGHCMNWSRLLTIATTSCKWYLLILCSGFDFQIGPALYVPKYNQLKQIG